MDKFSPIEFANNHVVEKIKEDLRQEWDQAVRDLGEDKSVLNHRREEIINGEFDKILSIYEKQNRSLGHYQNLLIQLEQATDPLAKLAAFYKNISYSPEQSRDDNEARSIEFARQFLDILELDKKQKKIFTQLF